MATSGQTKAKLPFFALDSSYKKNKKFITRPLFIFIIFLLAL